MGYVALKPIKVGGTQYYIDDEIPEGVLEPYRVKTLVARGDVSAKRKRGNKIKEPEVTNPPEETDEPEKTTQPDGIELPEEHTDENVTVKGKKAKKAGDV